jgi:hypothetical protein
VKLADAGPALAWQPQAVQTRGIPGCRRCHGQLTTLEFTRLLFFFFFFFAKQFTRLLCWPILPFVGLPQKTISSRRYHVFFCLTVLLVSRTSIYTTKSSRKEYS